MNRLPVIVMRVARRSPPGELGGAIAAELRRGRLVHLQCIGAQASYAAIKGVCAAKQFVEDEGSCLVCQPEFISLDTPDQGTRPGLCIKVWLLE